MPISAPPRGLPSSLASRQARPLNGLEVAAAIEKHLMVLTDKLLSDCGLLSDQVITLTSELSSFVKEELSKQSRLQKIHITYPKVGWNIKTRLEKRDDESTDTYFISAEVELDLEKNVRLNIRFGESGLGTVVKSLEEEKIPNSIPDKDRKSFGLKVEAEYVSPDGLVKKVNLEELKGPRKAARTVDVGSGADNRVPVDLPMEAKGVIVTERVLVAGGQVGEEIVLANKGPEITLEIPEGDLLAEVPIVPKEPPKIPLPPKGSMSSNTKPGVKFKR
jgi:hypothetical protein